MQERYPVDLYPGDRFEWMGQWYRVPCPIWFECDDDVADWVAVPRRGSKFGRLYPNWMLRLARFFNR